MPSRPSLPARAASREQVEQIFGQEFGRGVDALELRQVVEVVVVERHQRLLQHLVGAGDVDDDAVLIELVGEETPRE